MTFNNGSGTEISFSEIQAFYGGSNPISLSEYNRGGDQVPDSGTVTETVSASLSGGNLDWQRGPNSANANAQQITITIPANTTVNTTKNWSWSTTNNECYNFNDGEYTQKRGDQTLTWFGTTDAATGQSYTSSTFISGFGQVCRMTNPWKLLWYVSSGSGVTVTNSGGTIYNYNFSSATRGNSFPLNIRSGANPTYQISPPSCPSGNQGDPVSIGDASASGSITISGTAGSSGCTIKMAMVHPFNDPEYAAWMPPMSAFSGTRTTTEIRNTNIPTAIGVGNPCNLDLFNAVGSATP